MAKQTHITVNLGGLNNMLKQLGKGSYVKVGILGGNASAKHNSSESKESGEDCSTITNAEVGLIQEMGSITNKIPARSFLRMPIEEKKKDLVKFLGKNKIKELVNTGDVKKVLEWLGVEAEGIIDDAFRSGGFGKWEKNAPATIKAKGSAAPLIDTSQLRRSITSEVVIK